MTGLLAGTIACSVVCLTLIVVIPRDDRVARRRVRRCVSITLALIALALIALGVYRGSVPVDQPHTAASSHAADDGS